MKKLLSMLLICTLFISSLCITSLAEENVIPSDLPIGTVKIAEGIYTNSYAEPFTQDYLMNNPEYEYMTFKGGEIDVNTDDNIITFKNVAIYKSGFEDTNTYYIDNNTCIFEGASGYPSPFPTVEDFINGTAPWITAVMPKLTVNDIWSKNINNETIHIDGVWGFSGNVVGYKEVITKSYDEESDNVVHLKELGILNGDQNGKLKLERYITRAEFVKLIANINGFSQDAECEEYFADVPKEHWAFPYISYCKNKGLIQGTTTHEEIASGKSPLFNPDEFINVEDALKIALDVTGYLSTASLDRTYADIASELEFIDFMEIFNEKYLTRGNALTVVYNALHKPIINQYQIETNKSLYDIYFSK